MNLLNSYLESFFSLFFPRLCPGCGKSLLKNETAICTYCLYHLPYTNFHLDPANRAAMQLSGRISFTSIASFVYFKKGSIVQNLLHQLKYNNKPDIGLKLGEMYGQQLKDTRGFDTIDVIIPVPLHPAKLKKRGYNQSDKFAEGLSKALGAPCTTSVLFRSAATASQTRKNRQERYENIKNAFYTENPDTLKAKHILLVDDVLTTGATIEACATALIKAGDIKISIVTIAFTA